LININEILLSKSNNNKDKEDEKDTFSAGLDGWLQRLGANIKYTNYHRRDYNQYHGGN
jgi:hypothetical protein